MRTRFELAIVVALLGGPALAQNQKLPPTDTNYDSQLGGPYDPAPGVGTVSRDRTAPPVPGLYSICYVNAFQTQPDEADWWKSDHPDLLLMRDGSPFEDENWPGEYLFDITTHAKRETLAAIVGQSIDQCADDGFQAVEADNLDTWTRSDGLITIANAVDYARMLARRAHDNDLALAQKNAVELGRDGPALGFDFVITEDCAVYDDCDGYTAVYGTNVLQIEYDRTVFADACAKRGHTDVIVLRNRLLTPAGEPGHVFEAC